MAVPGSSTDRNRLFWLATGLVLVAGVLLVLYKFVGTFVFGLFIYYATRPVYVRLRRRTDHPNVAATIALLTLALPLVLLVVYALAIAIQEATAFASSVQSAGLQQFVGQYGNLSANVSSPREALGTIEQEVGAGTIRTILEQGVVYLGVLGNGALHLFVMFVLAFYLLRDGRKLSRWTVRTFGDDNGVLAAYGRAVDQDLQKIFFGNILNALMTAVIGVLAYNILNIFAPPGTRIPYASLLGILTGGASLIPVVGMKIVYFPVSGYLFVAAALSTGSEAFWFPVLFAAVSFLIVDSIPDLVLRPYVSGRSLHVGAVMLAYIFGPLLWGWYGIFLGPMLLVLTVQFVKIVLPELLSERSLAPYSVDPTYLGDDEN